MDKHQQIESSLFESLPSRKSHCTVESSHCTVPLQFFHTRVSFDLPDSLARPSSDSVECDEDGDLVVVRRTKQCCIVIEQCSSTPLELVGLQVWAAALLLSDFLLHNSNLILGKCVLELGAGVGLCSMVALLFAKKVICTDVDRLVLSSCQKNIHNFLEQCGNLCMRHEAREILIKELDWMHGEPLINKSECVFSWTEEEKQMLSEITIYLASDVIYDDHLTSAFFNLVVSMMKKTVPSILILSLEKRVNFVLDTLDVRSPPYEFFLELFQKLASEKDSDICWEFKSLPTDFPQYFHYTRTKYLELWMVECWRIE